MSAISEKQSILKFLQRHQYCFDCVQTLYSGRCELVLPVTICFIKFGEVLSDILASQKCIKWGWRIIKGWMTVLGPGVKKSLGSGLEVRLGRGRAPLHRYATSNARSKARCVA